MTLNSTFIAVLGRIDGKFSERPMALDFSKVEYIIPSAPWRGEDSATEDSEEMTAVLSSGTNIIFRVKDKDGNFISFKEFKKALIAFQKTPETVLVENTKGEASGTPNYFKISN